VTPAEAEYIVAHARSPYPEYIGDLKYRVGGQTEHGRYLQVIYVFGVDAEDIDWEDVDMTLVDMDDPDLFYVVHAMELPKRDRRQLPQETKMTRHGATKPWPRDVNR